MSGEAPLNLLLSRLQRVRSSGDGYTAVCPAHEDRSPSLSIRTTAEGRVLLKCHAGCESGEVLASLGLSWKDLHLQEAPRASSSQQRKAVTTEQLKSWGSTECLYEYQKASGEPLFLVARLRQAGRKKSFVQYRAVPSGGWLKGLEGLQTTLYRLPQLLTARQLPDPLVYLVEGEKDVETLLSLGLTATCNPGGAGKWREHFSGSLQGFRVVLIPDNDEVGHAHVQHVAQNLKGIVREIRVLELPDLLEKGDVSDWVAAGGNRETLEKLTASAPVWAARPHLALVPPPSQQFHLTDMGNAQRFARHCGESVRFCHAWQRWLIWDGKRWKTDSDGEIFRKAKDTVRSMYAEASDLAEERQRAAHVEHALRSESQARIKAFLSCAESEPGIAVSAERLDKDQWLLNCQNGTLDLHTGELRPHRQDEHITKCLPVDYDAQAGCPNWDGFLEKTVGRASGMVGFLQRAVGYALTGDTREHCLFFLYGSGRNGKSTFLETLYGLLGDYAQKADFGTFLEKKQESIRNDLARLKSCRFLSASEASQDKRFDESLVKDLTGGETITARHLYGEFFDFKPSFKLFLSSNHRPSIRGTDEGIWSRIRLVPFTNYIAPKDRDRNLSAKLKAEWPGILAWAVRGCLDWQKSGLQEPREVEAATQSYREEMDELAGFLSTACSLSAEGVTSARAVYDAYAQWAGQSGAVVLSQKSLGIKLAEKGFKSYRGRLQGQVVWLWSGFTLSHPRDTD